MAVAGAIADEHVWNLVERVAINVRTVHAVIRTNECVTMLAILLRVPRLLPACQRWSLSAGALVPRNHDLRLASGQPATFLRGISPSNARLYGLVMAFDGHALAIMTTWLVHALDMTQLAGFMVLFHVLRFVLMLQHLAQVSIVNDSGLLSRLWTL